MHFSSIIPDFELILVTSFGQWHTSRLKIYHILLRFPNAHVFWPIFLMCLSRCYSTWLWKQNHVPLTSAASTWMKPEFRLNLVFGTLVGECSSWHFLLIHWQRRRVCLWRRHIHSGTFTNSRTSIVLLPSFPPESASKVSILGNMIPSPRWASCYSMLPCLTSVISLSGWFTRW